MMHRNFIPLLALVLLTGCAGKPTKYLTLSAPPSDRTYIAAGAPVAVAHVEMPPTVDRLYLTTRLGDNQLHVADHTRWAAPLGGMTQRILARDLAIRVTGATVLMPGDQPPHGGVRLVRVNVENFVPDQTGMVTLDADWAVISPKQHRIAYDRAHIKVSGSRLPAAEAHSMSIAIGRLADQIAAQL
jgi:uncharacterized lipoprotein YmbA